jgi:hypothetical protein
MIIAAVVFLVVCLGLAGAAYWIHRSNQKISAEGVVVSGHVVGLPQNRH